MILELGKRRRAKREVRMGLKATRKPARAAAFISYASEEEDPPGKHGSATNTISWSVI